MESGLTQLLTGLSGVVLPFAGPTAPPGWLLCDGSSLLRADYKPLFVVIGSTYGSVDGTHFNLPDMRGRIAGGKDDMGGTTANRLITTLTGNVALGSAAISNISSTANLAVGMKVAGNGIPAGATIATITSATAITISANATVAGTGASLRFGVVDGQTLGDTGGAQAHGLTEKQMPAHQHDVGNAASNTVGGIYSTATLSGANGAMPYALTKGNNEAHPNIQPTIILNYIIKT